MYPVLDSADTAAILLIMSTLHFLYGCELLCLWDEGSLCCLSEMLHCTGLDGNHFCSLSLMYKQTKMCVEKGDFFFMMNIYKKAISETVD